jgi:hypothetical protein
MKILKFIQISYILQGWIGVLGRAQGASVHSDLLAPPVHPRVGARGMPTPLTAIFQPPLLGRCMSGGTG